MTREQRRSLYSLIIWGIVLVVFIPVFFSGVGPADWVNDDRKAITTAIVFGAGYIAFFTMMFLTKKRTKDNEVQKDERDVLIQGKSGTVSLVVLMAYIFITCILLYKKYDNVNSVPAGWMWFLAYSSMFLGWILHSLTSLIYYYKGTGRNG